MEHVKSTGLWRGGRSYLADRPTRPARFLVLGSASPDLLRQGSESLAGRIAHYELPGFSLAEVGPDRHEALWLRGGFPRSYLAASDSASLQWRREYIRTFLERDIPSLGVRVPATTLHRFWQMLAHYHAQTWNGAELARAFGVSTTAVRNYLDILTGALVVRQLHPWHENISKRQVKSPKVYVSDAGIIHALLGLKSPDEVLGHPKVGATWEGFVLKQILLRVGVDWREASFWSTHTGAELDLFVARGGRRLGFEIKRTTSPSVTRSMLSAAKTLGLDELFVIHAGSGSYPLRENIHAIALGRLVEDLPLSE